MKRTLRLDRETLTELSADELLGVAGAAYPTLAGGCIPTTPIVTCYVQTVHNC